jgi:uncharacterized protein (TIGR02453 family)
MREASLEFEGIGPKAARLMAELAHRQDREWYVAHKPELDAEVYAPLRALFAAAATELARLYPKRELDTHVFRVHRDVRFSKDKSPYKDHASAVIMVKGGGTGPTSRAGALYLQIGPDEGGAAGMWAMEPDQLARYRKALLHERRGAELEKILKPLLKKGHQIVSTGQLSRAPKGVDPLHPRASLLRHKGLALDFPTIPAKVRHKPALLDWCVGQAREVAPVVRWLLENVG